MQLKTLQLLTDVYKLATDIVNRSWQRKWNGENTGRVTYGFIPDVGTKVILPKKREVGVSYCRILIHDTMRPRQLGPWSHWILPPLHYIPRHKAKVRYCRSNECYICVILSHRSTAVIHIQCQLKYATLPCLTTTLP